MVNCALIDLGLRLCELLREVTAKSTILPTHDVLSEASAGFFHELGALVLGLRIGMVGFSTDHGRLVQRVHGCASLGILLRRAAESPGVMAMRAGDRGPPEASILIWHIVIPLISLKLA